MVFNYRLLFSTFLKFFSYQSTWYTIQLRHHLIFRFGRDLNHSLMKELVLLIVYHLHHSIDHNWIEPIVIEVVLPNPPSEQWSKMSDQKRRSRCSTTYVWKFKLCWLDCCLRPYLAVSISLKVGKIVHAQIMIFVFGSGQKSFRMYILHTLISSLKILPILSQQYVISPFCDFWESQNPALALLHYY